MSSEQSEYATVSPLEHVLLRPTIYIGDTTMHQTYRWLLDPSTGCVVEREIPFNEAVERLYLEILYNAADNVERSRAHRIDPGKIYVKMSPDTIVVRNEGRPISTKKQPGTDVHIPTFIFGQLRTSSNYDDSNGRRLGGLNGLGCKLANIFSLVFALDIGNANEKVRFRQVWKNNMKEPQTPVIEAYNGPSYTQVTFKCDFARFYDDDNECGFSGQRTYTAEFMQAYMKHALDVSVTANVPVHFNNLVFDCAGDNGLGLLKYAQRYFPDIPLTGFSSNRHVLYQTGDSICLFVDTPSKGTTVSFVNAVINMEHGVHVDTWRKTVFKPVLDHLKGKLKSIATTIKEKDVVEHVSMFLLCRLTNVKFKSQSKDRVVSPKPTTACTLPDGTEHNPSAMCNWAGIKRLEDILRARLNAIARKSDGSKKKIVEARGLMDAQNAGGPESLRCTLYVTEGDSAKNFGAKGITDGGYTGVMPLRGKFLNVSSSSIEQYAENAEVTALKKALGLVEGLDYAQENNMASLRYGRLVVLSDQDVDGMHIRGLLYNFFRIKYPTLLDRGFVQVMETPLLRVKYGGRILPFYYQREYDEWLKEVPREEDARRRITPKYYKGLGTSSDEELIESFQAGKFVTLTWDEKAEDLMAVAFDEGHENDRKEWLMTWNPETRTGMYEGQFAQNSMSRFVTSQLCEFSYTNVQRTIPSVVDGLKECQRKVIAVVLHMKGSKKVSQLKGIVSDKMCYKYGEESLYRTIVNLGNYCVGTNNIPLLKAEGQFDSRLGKCAAADRYISVSASPILRMIFRPEDDCILRFRSDEGNKLEPYHLYPILPPQFFNGARSIGSGFSTNIYACNPVDLLKYIVWWLRVRTGDISPVPGDPKYVAAPELPPFYRGYQGKIEKLGNNWYSVGAYSEVSGSRKKVKDIVVTEIPVTQTIDNYLTKLEVLKTKSVMKVCDCKGKCKCPTWIEGYKSVPRSIEYKIKSQKYKEVLPNIVIEGPLCLTAIDSNPLRTLGLIEKISDTNIVLLDSDGKPHQYRYDDRITGNAITSALDAYCAVRYDAYVLRRKTMITNWKKDIADLELERAYIQEVLDGKITFKGKRKAQVLAEITPRYPAEFIRITDERKTIDGLQEIDRDVEKLRAKIEEYTRTSPSRMWLKELEELFAKLDA